MQGLSSVLFDAVSDDVEGIAKRCREVISERVPAYAVMEPATLEAEIALQITHVLASIRDGVDEDQTSGSTELTLIAAARVRQGLLVDDLLRAWWIGVDTLIDRAQILSSRLRLGNEVIVELIQSILRHSDTAMTAVVAAYREAEFALGAATDQSRERFVLDVLSGVVSGNELATTAAAYGLDPAGRYVAVRGRVSPSAPPRKLAWVLGFRSGKTRVTGLSAVADGCVVGFLEEPPAQDIPVVAGFGPARPLESLAASYRLATRALATAEEFGLHGAFGISSVALRAAVSGDAEIGDALWERHLQPLVDAGSTGELIATLRAHLECGMQVERTAASLFVHQNTVRYRLSRFEELTGQSLRDVDVLFGLWWALQADRLGCSESPKPVRRFGGQDEPDAFGELSEQRAPRLGRTMRRSRKR